MKGSLPACGARFDLECAVSDADGRRGARDSERRANPPAREPTPVHEYLAGLMETLR